MINIDIFVAVCLVALGVIGLVAYLIVKVVNSQDEASKWHSKHDRMLSLKKSSEVRLGKIGENLAPFTDAWPYDPSNFVFLGRAVDGLQFNEDEIVFVEIKTGKSRLSKSQKRIKELIRNGKVYFETFRVDDTGCIITRAENK